MPRSRTSFRIVKEATALSSSHLRNSSVSPQLPSRLCIPQLACEVVYPDQNDVSTACRTTADHNGNCSALEGSNRESWPRPSQWQSNFHLQPAGLSARLLNAAGCSLLLQIGQCGGRHAGRGGGFSPRVAARLPAAVSPDHSGGQARFLPVPLQAPPWQGGDEQGCRRHHPRALAAASKQATTKAAAMALAAAVGSTSTGLSSTARSPASHAHRSYSQRAARQDASGNNPGSFHCAG